MARLNGGQVSAVTSLERSAQRLRRQSIELLTGGDFDGAMAARHEYLKLAREAEARRQRLGLVQVPSRLPQPRGAYASARA